MTAWLGLYDGAPPWAQTILLAALVVIVGCNAWVVLLFAPLAGVFAMGGLALLVAWLLAAHLHPDLGLPGARRQRRSGGAVLLP